MLSDGERKWLLRLVDNDGTWPDRPFLRSVEANDLMVNGLVEVIDPPQQAGRAKGLSYACITKAGREALEGGHDENG